MPFEIAPVITATPWVTTHPKEARALKDLAVHIRTVDDARWNYGSVWGECGSVGCALGHSPDVPSCAAIGIVRRSTDCLRGYPTWDKDDGSARYAFKLPGLVTEDIFFGIYESINVTQAMVADRIDHWLATGEIK